MHNLRLGTVFPRLGLGVRAKATSVISKRLEGKAAVVTASTDGLVVIPITRGSAKIIIIMCVGLD